MAAEHICPNLAKVFRQAQTSAHQLPETIDLDAAAREFNQLLSIKSGGITGSQNREAKKHKEQSTVHDKYTAPLFDRQRELSFFPGKAGPVDVSSFEGCSGSDCGDGVTMVTSAAPSKTPRPDKGMASLEAENRSLKETLTYQEVKIAELTTRLSEFASNQVHLGNPDLADLSDSNRPTKLGERFGEVYDNEWSDAYEDLKISTDEKEVLYTLSRIVRHADDFCQLFAEDQLKRFINKLDENLQHPVFFDKDSGKDYRCTLTLNQQMKQENYTKSLKLATEYRKQYATEMVPVVKLWFSSLRIPELFKKSAKDLAPSLQAYANVCVEVLWLMTVHDPPMVIRNAKEKLPIDTNLFKCYSRSGKIVDEPVWPAVFLHNGGPLVSKGYVLPQ